MSDTDLLQLLYNILPALVSPESPKSILPCPVVLEKIPIAVLPLFSTAKYCVALGVILTSLSCIWSFVNGVPPIPNEDVERYNGESLPLPSVMIFEYHQWLHCQLF